MSQPSPEPAPNVAQLLAFYLEAGVDCALGEEPVNRLAEPDLAPAPAPREAPPAPIARPMPAAPHAQRPRRTAARAGCRDRLRARAGAHRADAGGAARAAREIRRLRAEIDRDAAGLRRRQSEGAGHVRRRGAGPRRGHRGTALRRPLRQAARPHDRRDRARPHQGLYRQRHSLAAARQPHADAAGDADLPALHPAPDRAGRSRRAGHARQSLDPDAARHARRHHAHARQMARLRHRHAQIRALATFHPAYLLRSPSYKRMSWQDLRAIAKVLAK